VLWILTLLNALISFLDIAALAVLLFVVRIYTDASGSTHYPLPHWTYDTRSVAPILLFLLFFILKNLSAYFVYTRQVRFVYEVAARISRGQLSKYLDSDYHNYVQVPQSVHNRHINQQPIEFAHYILLGLQQIFTEGMLALISIIAILLFNTKIFLLLLIFLVPPVLLAAWITKRRLKSTRAHIKTDGEKAGQYLHEALDGYVESHIYGKKSFLINRYSQFQQKLNEHISQLQITQWLPSRLVEVFAVLGLFILILINKSGGNMVDIVSIGAFMAASYKIIPGLVRIANLSGQVRTYAFTLDGLEMPSTTTGSYELEKEIKSLGMRDSSLTHGDHIVLSNFYMVKDGGEFASISAVSGKGKTTLINLLLGFLKPESGAVLYNGAAKDREEIQHYHARISYVKQQSFLLNDTLIGNITLDEEGYDKTRLQKAVAMAGLQDFINASPDGLNRSIKDSGKNISGGQRQRIALARAFYKDADVYMLDEPFSELHADAEREIAQHLSRLAQSGKIVLLITHSSHSKEYCTKVLEL
jgi:ABC-type bacteriocin/lantibiotic exporter with double-glycine peptidase domain